ncbi:glycosyltransferase family 4 protein [Psychroserpens ponticola]|uniref:Glycosyltransferase family 4 protein n=1 Tax=Psychroserpens ponticola TaxID=2932268 RepID=A0ABY7RZE8_9FLAO|nr:glycosyltransferase family 4 protein [Psychroserpens ponticola]WCO02531.1 glycosyltransferase family 4 protein [Psychroserpens ponticola]
MSKTKVVYLVSGSRHTIPPNKKSPGVPRIIEKLSNNDTTSISYKVVSKYDDSLIHQDYNKRKYLHIKPTLWNRFFESILNKVPLRIKKRVYGYSLTDRIVYYEGIKRLIRKERPDVIITFMHFELFKKLCKVHPKAKHIYFFRSTDLKLRLGDQNIDFLINNSSGFLANTKSPIEELKTISPRLNFPTETIYNSVKLNDFTDKICEELSEQYRKTFNLKPDDFVIGYAGRLSEEKSVLELFEAVHYLKNKGLKVHVLVAGSIAIETTPNEDYYNLIVNYANENLSDQIHFLGWLPNEKLYEFYNALDIGVLLSKYSEGNSMFLLETLSMGTPMIATRIGGNLEMITDGENGFLIDIENVKQNLIQKLEFIISNRGQLNEMSTNALKYIKQHHTNDIMVDKFNNFMQNFE